MPQAAANEGQTKAPELDEVVQLHFVALVEREGQLWELDGRKSGPVPHGPTTKESLLQVSCCLILALLIVHFRPAERELVGRESGPMPHRPTTKEVLLQVGC